MAEKTVSTDDSVTITPESIAKQQQEEPASQNASEAEARGEQHHNRDLKGEVKATASAKEVRELRDALEAEKSRAEKQWDIAVRAKAEAENMRRRAERDVEKAHRYSVEKLLKELLPVLDSLEQGLASIDPEDEALQAVHHGMELTHKIFLDTIAKSGVVKLEADGAMFDPIKHEAMSMQVNADVEPGTILHVVQQGYTLHERLLRPARVVVAKAED